MLRYKGIIRFIKYKGLRLVEKIKLDSEDNYHYFNSKSRLLCLHSAKIRKVNDFKKFKTLKFNFNELEYAVYYDKNLKKYRFNNADLIPENDYENEDLCNEELENYEYHLKSCVICNHFHQPKSIRKRNKLTIDEKFKLSYYIGGHHISKSIMQTLDISKQTVKVYKRKLATESIHLKFNKIKSHTSVSITNQRKIINHNSRKPFHHPNQIKRELKLNCHPNTIKNVLSNSGIKSHLATIKPLVNSNQFNLRKRWCDITKHLSLDHWKHIVFTDEKCLQNYHNGTVKVYRRRGELNESHIYRRTLNRFKINLFGYITSNGLGNLYVLEDILNTEKYINYLHYDILPDVIEDVGPRFVWQQDGCGSHVSKLALSYFKKINANLLIWPPTSPDYNIIENVWSRFQKEVNDIIFNDGLPSTKEDLIHYAFRAWYLVGNDFVKELYKSLPGRVQPGC